MAKLLGRKSARIAKTSRQRHFFLAKLLSSNVKTVWR